MIRDLLCDRSTGAAEKYTSALTGDEVWHSIAPQVGSVGFDRQTIADHANNLASNVQGNLKRSLEAIGVVRTPCSRSLWFHQQLCDENIGLTAWEHA